MDRKKGKNDGSSGGVSYFKCKPGYGVFTIPERMELLKKAKKEKPTKGPERPPTPTPDDIGEMQSNLAGSVDLISGAFLESSEDGSADGPPAYDIPDSEMSLALPVDEPLEDVSSD